jgi:ABC-2 type transport system permease protein
MVNAFRYGLLGVIDISLALSYGISIGFIVILYLFSLHLLRKGHGIRT